jgi:hypothetical protein
MAVNEVWQTEPAINKGAGFLPEPQTKPKADYNENLAKNRQHNQSLTLTIRFLCLNQACERSNPDLYSIQ